MQKRKDTLTGAKITMTTPLSHTPLYDLSDEPANFEEAIFSPNAHFWQAGSNCEMSSHLKNAIFTIVPRPHDCNIVSTKVFWKLKNPNTDTPTYKARLVAHGFSQRYGKDNDDIFSPVPKTTTVHLCSPMQ
jgi:hypothetical protein